MPSRAVGKRGSQPSSRLIFAFEERAERTTASTALPPATIARERRRDPPRRADAERAGGERHEVVEGDRLVVGHVVDRARRSVAPTASISAADDVVDVDDVPQVRARCRSPRSGPAGAGAGSAPRRTSRPGRRRARGGRPRPAGPSRARAARPPAWSARRASRTGSGVSSVSSAPCGVAGDDRRGEHDPRSGRRVARRRAPGMPRAAARCRATLTSWTFSLAALRGDLGGEVDDAVRPRLRERRRRAPAPSPRSPSDGARARRARSRAGARARRPRGRARAARG